MEVHFPAFRAHPFVPGGHLQTILGCYFFHQHVPYAATKHLLKLPDGDQLVVHDDRPAKWQPNDPVALLVHDLFADFAQPKICPLRAALLRQQFFRGVPLRPGDRLFDGGNQIRVASRQCRVGLL